MTVHDGLSLIEKAKKETLDLIITDFNMPHLTGDKILDILKAEKIKTPVILISALKGDSLPLNRFDSFLQKPVHKEDLLKEVTKFLKHKVLEKEKFQKKKDVSFGFTIHNNLTKEELAELQIIHKHLKIWLEEMNVMVCQKISSND